MFLGVKKFLENFSRPRSGKNLSSENGGLVPTMPKASMQFVERKEATDVSPREFHFKSPQSLQAVLD